MNQLVRFRPFHEFGTLQREIDRLFDRFNGSEEAVSAVWAPRMDVTETDNAFNIRMDIPGVKQEDLTIEFGENQLTISGDRKTDMKEEGEGFLRQERTYGSFYRSFTLPRTANGEEIEATFENGVLNITVPKMEEAKPRRIEVGKPIVELADHSSN